MVYEIYYMPDDGSDLGRGHVMFDIEYYRVKSDGGLWFSEISCLPCVSGISYFLRDHISDSGFDFAGFVSDAEEIQEIRGLLYERYSNKPKDNDESYNFHYHVFGDVLEGIIKSFSAKYGLHVNID